MSDGRSTAAPASADPQGSQLIQLNATLSRLDERSRNQDARIEQLGAAVEGLREDLQEAIVRWGQRPTWITTAVIAAAGMAVSCLATLLSLGGE